MYGNDANKTKKIGPCVCIYSIVSFSSVGVFFSFENTIWCLWLHYSMERKNIAIYRQREGETLMRSKSADQTIHGCYSVTSPLTTSTIYTTNEKLRIDVIFCLMFFSASSIRIDLTHLPFSRQYIYNNNHFFLFISIKLTPFTHFACAFAHSLFLCFSTLLRHMWLVYMCLSDYLISLF